MVNENSLVRPNLVSWLHCVAHTRAFLSNSDTISTKRGMLPISDLKKGSLFSSHIEGVIYDQNVLKKIVTISAKFHMELTGTSPRPKTHTQGCLLDLASQIWYKGEIEKSWGNFWPFALGLSAPPSWLETALLISAFPDISYNVHILVRTHGSRPLNRPVNLEHPQRRICFST